MNRRNSRSHTVLLGVTVERCDISFFIEKPEVLNGLNQLLQVDLFLNELMLRSFNSLLKAIGSKKQSRFQKENKSVKDFIHEDFKVGTLTLFDLAGSEF